MTFFEFKSTSSYRARLLAISDGITFLKFKSTSSYRARPLALSTKINTFYDLNPLAHIELDNQCAKVLVLLRHLNPLAHIELDFCFFDHMTLSIIFKSTSSYRARHIQWFKFHIINSFKSTSSYRARRAKAPG